MEKIKYFLWFIFMSAISTHAQTDVIRPGLISAKLTLSPSYFSSDQNTYFYLHGNLEGYLNKKLSIAGEGYYYLGNEGSAQSQFDYNHSIFFGASWHFVKKHNDLYVGIQPGISITRLNAGESGFSTTHTGANPLFSTLVGYNFFLNRIFHFFVQTRIVVGEHNYDTYKSLTEIRFSAGLGFNINTMKQK